MQRGVMRGKCPSVRLLDPWTEALNQGDSINVVFVTQGKLLTRSHTEDCFITQRLILFQGKTVQFIEQFIDRLTTKCNGIWKLLKLESCSEWDTSVIRIRATSLCRICE